MNPTSSLARHFAWHDVAESLEIPLLSSGYASCPLCRNGYLRSFRGRFSRWIGCTAMHACSAATSSCCALVFGICQLTPQLEELQLLALGPTEPPLEQSRIVAYQRRSHWP